MRVRVSTLPARVVRPYLQVVAEQLHGSSSLAVIDHYDVVSVAPARSPSLVSTTVDVGSRLPAHVTALGRVLLADLPDEQIDRYLEGARGQRLTDHTKVDPREIKHPCSTPANSGTQWSIRSSPSACALSRCRSLVTRARSLAVSTYR
jgi:DNA-binding IclR family transcriptional regulator